MGYFPVRYDSRVVNYDRKMFIRLATDRMRRISFVIVNVHVVETNCLKGYFNCPKNEIQ